MISSDIMNLSIDERLKLVDMIWDTIAQDATNLPLTAEQKSELDSRLEDLEQNPETGSSWAEVRRRMQSKL